MIDRLSGRIALLLVTIAFLVIVLLGWFVLVTPERSKASKLDNQIGDTNTELQSVTSLLNGPAGRQALISLRVLKRAIPDTPGTSQIIRQLSDAAARSKVEIDGITPSAPVPGAGSETLPITLNLSGHYFGLQRFLSILRTDTAIAADNKVIAKGRLYSVQSIEFQGDNSSSAVPGQTPTSKVVASVSLSAYMYAPGSVTPAPTTTETTTTP